MASAWSQLDQLLTCAICLDRYRNPKLLPCQHTFCVEPCLDGLIDYARRQIKCPECRAEHRIPYQGIQQFPTNVTLVRFLELHRDVTGEEPEPPPSCMERCGVCSEKANVERCAHCDKKICPDCREAHVDILRREINRINNQVRRGLHKLSEALTQTKKNAEKLQLNCRQVKDEIDDIVRRYSKDLKVTEDKLKHDLETYTQNEMKAISKLKEDLEVEVNNISSNCELVDKYIKDDYEWSDLELLEYKQIFLKMLDFLRNFDVDNTDFTRRIKFQPRADPDVLHRNIADFGELKINAPMNPVPTQQTLMPSSNALMRSQSDHRLAAQFARRCDNRSFSDINQRMDNDRERPTSPLLGRNRRDNEGYRRYSERSRDYDYQDRASNRYSREDTALSSRWRDSSDDYGHRNRYPRDYEEPESEPHQGRTVRFADENQQQRERIFDLDDSSKGPLSGVVKLLDSPKVLERLHQNEVKQKLQQSEKDQQASTPTTTTPAPVAQPRRPASRQQSEDDIDRQKRANQQASSSQPESSRRGSNADSARLPADTAEPPQAPEVVDSSVATSCDDTTEPPKIQSRFNRSSLVKATSLDAGETSRKPLDKKLPPRAATPVHHTDAEDSEESEEEPAQSSFFGRQRRLPEPEPRLLEMHETDEEESGSEEESEEEAPDPEASDSEEEESSGESGSSESEESAAFENAAPATGDSQSQPSESDEEESDEPVEEEYQPAAESPTHPPQSVDGRRSRKRSDDTDSSSSSTPYHSLSSPAAAAEDPGGHETGRFRRRPLLARSKSSHELGLGEEEQPPRASEESSGGSNTCWAQYLSSKYGAAGRVVPRSRSSHSLFPKSGSESSEEEPSGRDPYGFSTPRSNYLQKRRMLLKVGSRGAEAGQFTWPRGVAVGLENSIVVADSSNHRIQVFDSIGKFLFEFGTYGSGDGEFDCPAGVSVNRIGQFIVSDRYNNRVQLFDPTGRFLRAFGCEGRTDGRFSYPWGIATDSLGFIYVCDKENHRIQVFQSDGTFVGKFGGAGSRPGQLEHPHYIAVTNTNRVVVSDTHNHRVQIFDVNGRSLAAFGSEGSREGQFKFPKGVAVDDQGYIVVGDGGNNRVQVFQPDGTFLKAFGAWGAGDGEFKGLEGLAVTGAGSVVVCDRENHRIQVF